VSRRTHPSKFGGVSTNSANLELMRRSQRQLELIYRYRRGGEVRTPGKEAGKGALRILDVFSSLQDSFTNPIVDEKKDGGWIPSSDFGFVFACIICKHAIFN